MQGIIGGLICIVLSIFYFYMGDLQVFAIYNVGSLILLTRDK